jgi:hypothetical protein
VSEDKLAVQFAELVPVKPLPGTEHVVSIFNELSNARSVGMSGPLPISWTEIKAYVDLTQEPLQRWELSAVRAMDDAYIQETYALLNKE